MTTPRMLVFGYGSAMESGIRVAGKTITRWLLTDPDDDKNNITKPQTESLSASCKRYRYSPAFTGFACARESGVIWTLTREHYFVDLRISRCRLQTRCFLEAKLVPGFKKLLRGVGLMRIFIIELKNLEGKC